jgi:hypothetical protein
MNYSEKILNTLQRIPNSETTIERVIKTRNRTSNLQTKPKETKKIIKEFLEKENLLQVKIEQKPSAVDI